ncbi:hypothetical protein [Streptomyces sp.]|uniref:hypothetical protein n=1 Tax=Streptomyces sp. TaxID=1931 RepID=UPI002F943847
MPDEPTIGELVRRQDAYERRTDLAIARAEAVAQSAVEAARRDCQAASARHLDIAVYTAQQVTAAEATKDIRENLAALAQSVKWATRTAIGALITLGIAAVGVLARGGG